MNTGRNLSKLEGVPLREAWSNEANEFTPWLAEPDNLNMLAEALGVSELVWVATEHWVGDFKLDILCTDGDDQVIIENQLARSDHAHLGQIIAYAAGAGANKVIWIAESFRPEHLAALQFLNDNTTGSLNFFAVEVKLWRIGDSPLAPQFDVVVKPNEWVQSGRDQVRAAAASTPIKQLQQQFWLALIEWLAIRAPHIRPQKARLQHWLVTRIGRSGFELNCLANTRDGRLGVELWLAGYRAKHYFRELITQKQEIESRLGFELDWQELPEALGCRIAVWYPDASLEDRSRWDEYMNWFTQQLVTMDQVLRPIVRALP
jgi:hypothetical protein